MIAAEGKEQIEFGAGQIHRIALRIGEDALRGINRPALECKDMPAHERRAAKCCPSQQSEDPRLHLARVEETMEAIIGACLERPKCLLDGGELRVPRDLAMKGGRDVLRAARALAATERCRRSG